MKYSKCGNEKMKKVRLNSPHKFFVILVTVLAVLGVIAIVLKLFDGSKSDSEKIKAIFSDYSAEYEVIKESDDGTYEVKVIAPDFAVLVEEVLGKEGQEITAKALQDAIKDSPDTIKTYMFTVNNLSDEEISGQFLDDIAYDIMIVAIQNSDYEEGAGVK